jgi:pyridoxamine-phosphate oxidase
MQIITEMNENIKINKDPFSLFNEWYSIREKSGTENYNAVALSTAGNDGRISSRMVLLKQYDRNGFVFFTNYGSRKGIQLSQNPKASLLFHWPEQRRQIRIEGEAGKVSDKESDEYFMSRKTGHKLNAIVSSQSTEIPGKKVLIDSYNELVNKYRHNSPERPPYWGGYRLSPDMFEFWEEGENRFHDRIEYRLHGNKWVVSILAP